MGQCVEETAPTIPMVTVSALAIGDRAIVAPASSAANVFLRDRATSMFTPSLLGGLRAIVSRDLRTGRLPHPRVIADVAERGVEGIDAMRYAGEIGMQRNRHDATRLRALAIEHVELPANHVVEFVGGAVQ